MADNNFWEEVSIETTLHQAEITKDEIISVVPHDQLYTITGEINRNTRWGAALWELTQFISNIENLGF